MGRYQRRQSRKTQYREYLDFVLEVGLSCGFHVQEDCLRIPSTKRVCARAGTGLGRSPSGPILRLAAFPSNDVYVGKSCSSQWAKVHSEVAETPVSQLQFYCLSLITKEGPAVSDPVLELDGMHGAQKVLGGHPAGGDQTPAQMLLSSKSRAHGRARWPQQSSIGSLCWCAL